MIEAKMECKMFSGVHKKVLKILVLYCNKIKKIVRVREFCNLKAAYVTSLEIYTHTHINTLTHYTTRVPQKMTHMDYVLILTYM